MIRVNQEQHKLVSTVKSVDWLTHNTSVSTFNPVTFDGYQRQIDEKHCVKIVEYLKGGFLMPGAIICACDGDYNEEVELRVVDGQHRVAAFRLLEQSNPERYAEISLFEVPVIVMVNVDREVEIETFITINKTSKKVDTSLAYVLKNMLSRQPDNMAMSKAEYIAVEVARLLNDGSCSEIWKDAILYEGAIRQTDSMISLNSFVRATRVLISTLGKMGVVSLNWDCVEQVQELSLVIADFIAHLWKDIYAKWPDLYNSSLENRSIIQGSIGYTSITRTLVKMMRTTNFKNMEEVFNYCEHVIEEINIDYINWLPRGVYSRFSSEAGYRFVSEDLIKSINKGL